MSKFISIVIPTYNRIKLLQLCLNSLMHQTYQKDKYEIIVVDDGSSDDTSEYLAHLQRETKNLVYINQANAGHAVARNNGFLKAKGELIVSLDDDCIPIDNWLSRISREFESSPDVAILCGRIMNPINSRVAWAEYLIDFSLWMGPWPKNNLKIIYSANVAYRREAVEGTKFLEDGKNFGYRDILFHHQLVKKGFIARYCPEIKVKHHKWESNGIGNKVSFFINGQMRHGAGLRFKGYQVYGKYGSHILKLPSVCYIVAKSILIFCRALVSGLLLKYICCFNYIVLGLKYQAFAVKGKSGQTRLSS